MGEATYEHASGRRIYLLRITQLDISSTRIRDLARTGGSIKYLVPTTVERYIISRGIIRRIVEASDKAGRTGRAASEKKARGRCCA